MMNVPRKIRGTRRRRNLDVINFSGLSAPLDKKTAAPERTKKSGIIQRRMKSLNADRTGLRTTLNTTVV
jgi:hypothetical protein